MCLASIAMTELAVPDIVAFATTPPQVTTAKPERVVAGDPVTIAHNYFSDPSGVFFAGQWESTSGRWRVTYSEYEFCYVLRGRVRIEATSGKRWEFGAGDAFVVPSGFSGVWEVLEPMAKLYVIFEP
jgi:uncharacterized cupin superfamily protein